MTYVAPAHITGFFYPIISEDPMLSGSMGAGFSLRLFSFTEVKKGNHGVRIYINGVDRTREACTSKKAVELFFKEADLKENITVNHTFNFPVGCGLASSGAGALGIVFELNNLFDTGFSRLKLAQIAHIAEIECKTGLGSVVGQYDGMFEIRLRAGAPGVGSVSRYKVETLVGLVIYGPLKTERVLSTSHLLKRIKEAFGKKNYELKEKFSVEKFVELSRKFAEASGILTDKVMKTLNIAKSYNLNGSMLMLGEGVFLFGYDLEERFKEFLTDIRKIAKPIYTTISTIDNLGVREV